MRRRASVIEKQGQRDQRDNRLVHLVSAFRVKYIVFSLCLYVCG